MRVLMVARFYGSAWRFLFENNTVSCNRADADGGGMYVIVGDLILRHSTIYQNSAGDEGGGLYAVDDTGRIRPTKKDQDCICKTLSSLAARAVAIVWRRTRSTITSACTSAMDPVNRLAAAQTVHII